MGKFCFVFVLASTELQFYLNSNKFDGCFAHGVGEDDEDDVDAAAIDNDGSVNGRR